jgi:hypothetical protein
MVNPEEERVRYAIELEDFEARGFERVLCLILQSGAAGQVTKNENNSNKACVLVKI